MPSTVSQLMLHSSLRAASRQHESLKLGIDGLKIIATIAPMFALIGAVVQISGSFRSYCGPPRLLLGILGDSMSEALLIILFGLSVALFAKWCHHRLSDALETFDRQMTNTASSLSSELSRYATHFPGEPRLDAPTPSFANPSRLWPTIGTVTLLAATWSLRVTSNDRSPTFELVLTFLLCLAPAHFIWRRYLHSRTGVHALLTSLLCLVWTLVERF